jgi:hypothetical protein
MHAPRSAAMGPDRGKHLRNIAIILVLAVAVWRLPGGDQGSSTILNLLGIIFWGGLIFLAYRLYMENRTMLFDMEDRMRGILYGSAGLAAITLVATSRLWNAGGAGALLWFALMGAAVYGLYSVFRASREY